MNYFIYFFLDSVLDSHLFFSSIFQHQLIIYHWTLPSQQFITLPLPHSPSSPLLLFLTLSLPHSPSPPPSPSPTLPLSTLFSIIASCFTFCRGVRTNVTKYRKDLFSRALKKILLKASQRLSAFAQFQMNKEGKFLKKLRCCVFGKVKQGNLV